MRYSYFVSWKAVSTSKRVIDSFGNGEIIMGSPITSLGEIKWMERVLLNRSHLGIKRIVITNFQLLRTEPELESP